MARQYDRYGRNRQFRSNPTRSRRFFPNQLPFQADFRLNQTPRAGPPVTHKKGTKRPISDESSRPNTRQKTYFTSYGAAFAVRQALSVGEVLLGAAVPEAIIPIMGVEMMLNPKRWSHGIGGVTIAGTLAKAVTAL